MSAGSPFADAVGRSLGHRVRDVLAGMSRADAFVTAGPAAPAADVALDEDARQAVHALLLRALRVFADPYANRVVTLLRVQEPGSVTSLAVCLGVPRALVWELVNDLVQVGLAQRDPTGREVVLTPAGAGLADLLDQLVDSAAGTVASRLTPAPAVVP